MRTGFFLSAVFSLALFGCGGDIGGLGSDGTGSSQQTEGAGSGEHHDGSGGGGSEPTCDQLRAEGASLPDRCQTGATGGGEQSRADGGEHHDGTGGGEQSGAGGGSSEPTCDQLRAEGVTPLPDRCQTCDQLRAEGVNPLPDRCGTGTGGGAGGGNP